MRMMLESKGEKAPEEVIALAINISTCKKNAELMCQDQGLKFLMKKAMKTKDPMHFKLLRNIAFHPGQSKMLFLDYVDDIMHIVFKSVSQPDILVELLGILGNLSIPDFDYAKLSTTYNLHDFIACRLQASAESIGTETQSSILPIEARGGLNEDDDVLLEFIILLGTMAIDDAFAPLVLKSNVIPTLMELMMSICGFNVGKEEDDEIILQIVYLVYNLLLHPQTRTFLLSKTRIICINVEIVSYLIDLLYDRNVEIRKMCDSCLDIIAEIDDEWVCRIKLQKFQWHNAEFLATIAQTGAVCYGEDELDNGDEYNLSL